MIKKAKKIIAWCFATLPRKIISSLIILGLLLSSIWLLLLRPKPVEASWWDEDWLYRRAVVITNSTTAETDVFISFDGDTTFINTNSDKFQADCGDLRFTKIDGTQLDYYIDSDCHTSSTVVHVKLDMLQTGDQTIYFYYGNPSADNGFIGTGFSTEASSYSIGTIQNEETGTGPVLWLKFDEGYGTTAFDSSEQNNDGTLEGDPTWTDSGKFDKALNFDGDGDYVHVGDIDTEVKTVTLWIRPNAVNVTEEPLDLNGDAYVKIIDGTVTGQGFVSPTVYVNGIVASTVTTGWNFIAITTGTGIDATDLDVGRLDAVYFNGIIDEVKIYPYARDAEQIKRDYNKGAAARIGRDDSWLTDGLVGYWKMDEDSWIGDADEVEDSSGAGNHGTGKPTNGSYTGPTTAAGKFHKAGTFDGDDDYVQIPSNLLVGESQASISVWVYPTGSPEDAEGFISQYWSYSIYDDDVHGLIGTTDDRVVAAFDYDITANYNKWVHFVLTYDGSKIRAYTDGVFKNDAVLTGTIVSEGGLIQGYIGQYYVGGYNVHGTIDDARIYNRALSGFEIQRLYDWGPGPVGHWKFDEGFGSDANDSSENANTGAITDATWKNAAECKYGNCLSFDGNGDYVDTGINTDTGLDNNFTLVAWIKASSVPGAGGGILGSVNHEFTLETHHEGNRAHFTIWSGGDDEINLYSPVNSVYTDVWYHIAITYGNRTATMYIDGSNSAQGNANNALNNFSSTFLIGRAFQSDYFNGLIDDVKIYNYARTQKQIVEDMVGGPPSSKTSEGGAVLHLKFDEGFGIIAYDASGRGHNLDFSSSTESYTMSGKFGKAWDGDGSKYLSHANDADFNFTATEDFSISGWFKHSPISEADYIIAKYKSEEGGYKIYMDLDGDIAFAIDDDDDGASWDPGDVIGNDQARDYDDNSWHYFAAVKRGTSSIRLYVDGREIDNDTDLAETGTLVNTDLLYVGIDSDHSTGPFDGELDEIKIYRFALSPEEILLDYNKGKSVIMGAVGTELQGAADQKPAFGTSGSQLNTDHPLADGLVGLWLMNENTGTSVADLSGEGNTGTIIGPSWVPGKFGSSLEFEANDAHVKTDTVNHNIGTGDFTWLFWVRPTVLSSSDCIMARVNYAPGLFVGNVGALQIYWGAYYTAGAGLTLNVWQQVILLRENGIIKFYINAVQTPTTHSISTSMGNGAFYFGVSNTALAEEYKGRIDHAVIYNRALSANEIKWLYAEPFVMLNLPTVPSFSQNRAYCPPGHVGLCNPPVAEYKFDEYSGSDAYDTSANTNNGTITGATWKGSGDCKYNSCLNFDGTGDYVDAGNNASLDLGGAATVCAWIYPRTWGDNDLGRIFDNGKTIMWVVAAEAIAFYNGNGGSYPESAGGSVSLNTWQHACVERNASGIINMYVNGALSGDADRSAGTISPASHNTYIATNDTARDFDGLIDDVKIFDYALTQEQVAWVYNKGSPVGQWKFDEGEGSTATDSSENNNSGTISGADWSSGRYNSALDFKGDTDDDVVTVAIDSDIDLNNKTGYSVCGWINPDSDGQDSEGEWFSKGNSYIRVDTESGGTTVEVSALFDLATDASLNTTQTIPIGSWSHICTTWKNDDDDELTIYINGINAGSSTNGSGAPFDDSDSHLNIGGDSDKNFDGDIDEVTIYNYELTSQQVKLDYNQGSALRFGD